MPRDPYDINAIFEEMILELIASLKRNFQRHKEDEMDEGFRWEMWQMAKLRAINAYRNRNKKIIENALNEAEKIVDEVLQESYEKGERMSLPLWYSFVNLILKPFKKEIVRVEGDIKLPVDFEPKVPGQNIPHHLLPQAPPEESFFKVNEKKLGALQQSVKNDLRKAQFAVLRKMDDVYRQVIYKAEVNMAAGAKTLNQAIDMATKEFLSKGINTIQYADGRMVDIASYAETALRTASQRATFLGEGKKRDEWGIYTVVMSTHDNCSPWCLPYQGKVMIDDVYTSIPKERAQQLSKQMGYPLLSTAMSNGAFHPNCRHTLSTFFPGVSKLPPKTDSKKALANYKAEQKQRSYERQIRKYKRLEAGSLDEENKAKYSAKVKEWQEKLKAHLEENPQLRRDYIREKVEGGLTSKERNEILKQVAEREKIEEIRRYIKSDKQPKNLHMGQQGKHIKGHSNYIPGRSYITISPEEVQELINKYAGTGEIRFTKKGEWDKKEIIISDKIIGVVVNKNTGEEVLTTGFKIHYSKKGVHIVPYKRK
jgi:hypothetical protein